LGKDKSRDENSSRQEKRWNHPCWAKTAFPVNEGSLGGKKESCRSTVDVIKTKLDSRGSQVSVPALSAEGHQRFVSNRSLSTGIGKKVSCVPFWAA
jgi:hypothetical protein